MGVNKRSYLLYGFKFTDKEEKKALDEHYEDLMESKQYGYIFNSRISDQTVVYDYMCGNYIYVGVVLARLDEDECDEHLEISDEKFNNLKVGLKEYMKQWPDYLLNVAKDKEPKLYFFIYVY